MTGLNDRCRRCGEPLQREDGAMCHRCLLDVALSNPEDEILEEALKFDSREESTAYVRGAAVDDPLLCQRLLQRLEDQWQQSDLPKGSRPADLEEIDGRFKVIRQLGEGGFGSVYLARQISPVTRFVALKIIKPGMDSRQVVARFEAERQALAMMDHPNIAQVFDAGTTSSGRPYFAMEVVQGAAITCFCDEQQLSIRERLELFLVVCQAVQHAHQKGIIHRDIKPSNILVAGNRGNPIPKIIDFGIAKATQSALTPNPAFTSINQLTGTPAYISPEQAELRGTDIDTRSDIYSLGVLLYELLTGETPLDSERLARAGLDEMLRAIRDQDPPPPSVRIKNRTKAQTRSALPNRVHSQVDSDLDCIVMKCLEKERTRRYATANGLAMDIRRYLQSEPILAKPQTFSYRLVKWIRRNPTVTVLCGILVTGFITALAVGVAMSLQIAKAKRAGDRANVRLSETIRYLEWQRMEELVSHGRHQRPIAWFAKQLRNNPRDRVVASRVISGLTRHNFALPAAAPLQHGGPVNSADFSPDGSCVATACEDGKVSIWSTQDGKLIRSFTNASPVTSVSYFADGTRLMWATRAGEVGARDANSGRLIFRAKDLVNPHLSIEAGGDRWAYSFTRDPAIFRWDIISGHGPELVMRLFAVVSHVSRAGDRLAIGCEDGTVLILAASSGALLAQRQDPGKNWEDLELTPDGRRLFLSYGQQASVAVWKWDLGDDQSAVQWFEPPASIRIQQISFLPDGTRFVTAGWRGELRFWDANSLLPFKAVNEGMPLGATISHDGSEIASFSQSGVARVYAAHSGEPLIEAFEHDGPIRALKFSRSGEYVVTASQDGTARIWNVRMRATSPTLLPMGTGGGEASFSPDATRVVASIRPDAVQVCDAATGLPVSPPLEHPSSPQAPSHVGRAAFSPDGSRIVTVGQEGLVRVWDANTFEPIYNINVGRPLNMARFSPDGKYIVAVDRRGYISIWSGATGHPITEPVQHLEEVVRFNFHPDGKVLLTASVDGTARCWSLPDLKPLLVLRHRGIVWAASFSSDGQRIVTASADRTARVWDARSGEPIGKPLRHEKDVFSASFSPNGEWVLTTSEDATARVWDASTGEPVSQIMQHAEKIWVGTFSPDGTAVATGSNDRTVRIWDARTGLPLTTPLQHPGHLGRLAFSPDGRRLLSFGGEPARIWDLISPPPDVPDWFPEFLEAIAGYRITDDNQFIPVPPGKLVELRRRVLEADESDFFSQWATWFLTGRFQAPRHPPVQ